MKNKSLSFRIKTNLTTSLTKIERSPDFWKWLLPLVFSFKMLKKLAINDQLIRLQVLFLRKLSKVLRCWAGEISNRWSPFFRVKAYYHCVFLNNLDSQLNMSYTDTYNFISEWNTHGLFLNTVYTCAHRTPLLLYNNIDSVWKKQYTIKTFFLDIIWHGAVTHILTAFKNSTGNVTSRF